MGETPHDLFYQFILIDLYRKSTFSMKNKGLCDRFFMTSEYEKNDKILWVIVDNLFVHMMKSRILPINLCTEFPPCQSIDVCTCLRLCLFVDGSFVSFAVDVVHYNRQFCPVESMRSPLDGDATVGTQHPAHDVSHGVLTLL